MFPVSSMLIAAVNTAPQIIVVLIISLFFGWTPSILHIAAILLAVVIVALLATGLGMLFGAVNVTFRDAQSFVEIIVMCAVWASPVMYQWEMVADQVPQWLFTLYRLNPLTAAVELFHYGIWFPLGPSDGSLLPDLPMYSLIALGVSIVMLFVGQAVFRRLEGRFAQDL
jgi:ABC-2 type transport system permease protein